MGRKEQIDKFLKEIEEELKVPRKAKPELISREYKRFKEEEAGKLSWYERFCKYAGKLNLGPPSDFRLELRNSIKFAHLNVSPTGAFSLGIIATLGAIGLSIGLAIQGLISPIFALILFIPGAIGGFYLINYPKFRARSFRVEASGDIIMAIIYMVISMRARPNFERAIKFTAANLTGPLAYDLRKLLWDIDVGRYVSVDEALGDFIDKWEANEQFVEALELIRASLEQPESKRHGMLDEAVELMISGSREKMRDYSRSLKMPIMIIHALGIMLPVLVLVMFPILMLMLHKIVKPIFLIIGYDILLPVTIYFMGRKILEIRPFGFATPDISLHPKSSPLGKINFFGRYLPIWPFAALIGAIGVFAGIYMLGTLKPAIDFAHMSYSLIITWALGLAAAFFFLMDARGKTKIRDEIKNIDREFAESIFTLGHRLGLGKPFERAMEDTARKESDLAIAELFKETLANIRRSGMTIRDALFDKRFGAVWDFPSRLVINVFRVIYQATRKGARMASSSALSIARYIKGLHRTEKELRGMLSSAVSSMKLLGMFLAPLVAGVTVTMAAIMMMIFVKLGATMESLQLAEVPGMSIPLIGGWGGVVKIIPLEIFQLIVGIYIIEIAYLLSMLASGIKSGSGDKISERELAGTTIIIGLLIYSLTLIITWNLFGSSIQAVLSGGAVS